MHVAAIRVELRLRGVRSLKEKRRIVKAVVSDLSQAFPASVAEVDHQDLWQRCSLGIALVAPQAGRLTRLVHSVGRRLEERTDVEVLSSEVAYSKGPS